MDTQFYSKLSNWEVIVNVSFFNQFALEQI